MKNTKNKKDKKIFIMNNQSLQIKSDGQMHNRARFNIFKQTYLLKCASDQKKYNRFYQLLLD